MSGDSLVVAVGSYAVCSTSICERRPGCPPTMHCMVQPPQHRIIGFKMSIMSRLRNPVVDKNIFLFSISKNFQNILSFFIIKSMYINISNPTF